MNTFLDSHILIMVTGINYRNVLWSAQAVFVGVVVRFI